MVKISKRSERIAEEIRRVVSQSLLKNLKLPIDALVTINHVVMSPDISRAKVYFSVFGNKTEQSNVGELLKKREYLFKKEIASKIHMKKTPKLIFAFDDTTEKAANVHKLLLNPNFV